MAIIVEDGTNVAEANSFISRAELIEYAAFRGITIPDNDSADVLLIRAMDYLEARPWLGEPAYPAGLFWPRTGVNGRYGHAVADDVIPNALKKAQAMLGVAAFNGIELLPDRAGGPQVIRRKTGPLETQYASPTASVGSIYAPSLPAVDAMLTGLISPGGINVQVYKG